MPNSNDEGYQPLPKSGVIENQIIRSVRELRDGDVENFTVNGIRKHVEETLDLPEGHLKKEGWKDKSKELIHKAIVSVLVRSRGSEISCD